MFIPQTIAKKGVLASWKISHIRPAKQTSPICLHVSSNQLKYLTYDFRINTSNITVIQRCFAFRTIIVSILYKFSKLLRF